jgi:DNA processing protein
MDIKTLAQKQFPRRLLEIPSPPSKLFIRGSYPDESYKFLAVVGARKYTPYGKDVTEKLIAGLTGYPIVIVSGLALGIDSLAHESALRAGLTTIALPGSGLDPSVIYPRTHQGLSKRILESGGALVSEFSPKERAAPWMFPMRNRIMAGIADAVLVIEAEAKSGTLITSKYATEYNRDVFAVPGNIFSPNSAGPHLLLDLGAKIIRGPADILEGLGLEQTSPQESSLSALAKQIIAELSTPKTADELSTSTKEPLDTLLMTLTSLEIDGIIVRAEGLYRKK